MEPCRGWSRVNTILYWSCHFFIGTQSGHSLRTLFSIGLLSDDITDLVTTWDQFRESFCNDFIHRLRRKDAIPANLEWPHLDYGLFLLLQLLEVQKKRPSNYNLPTPQWNWVREEENTAVRAELPYDIELESEAFEYLYAQLNTDQQYCFEVMVSSIQADPATAQFFLQGLARTGKTLLY